MQKNKFFLSLNAKIFLFLFTGLAIVCSVFLSYYMNSYVEQLGSEAYASRKKAEVLLELYEENVFLREIAKDLYEDHQEQDENGEHIASTDNVREFLLRPQNQRYQLIRRELLMDMKGAKDRDKKIQNLGYFILASFLLVFFVLELLWLLVRRWILRPIENLLEATHRLASGDLSFRVPVALNISQRDELALLAEHFNQMAESIEKNVKSIEEGKAFLKKMIDTIPDGVRVLDEDFNIVLTNTAYDKMNYGGITGQVDKCYAAWGRDCPCASEQKTCSVRLLKENPDAPFNVIQHYADENGRERYIEVSAAATTQKGNTASPFRVIELMRPLDKTIKFSHQQKLSSVGMLASSVAHEMRNPLGSVRLILENILDKIDRNPMKPEDLKKYLGLVNEQIGFCIDVTSRLLKLAHKPDTEQRVVDVNEIISETACLLEYEAKKAGITVKIEPAEKEARIMALDADMRMLTVNLMQNAFHAMPNGGSMTIKILNADEKVNIDFCDTGTGIAPENLTRIFEPFFSKRDGQDKEEGTGLGLPIVKTVVQENGGTINVESVLGQGTVFHLCFPAVSENERDKAL